jgi:hypothetical protein
VCVCVCVCVCVRVCVRVCVCGVCVWVGGVRCFQGGRSIQVTRQTNQTGIQGCGDQRPDQSHSTHLVTPFCIVTVHAHFALCIPTIILVATAQHMRAGKSKRVYALARSYHVDVPQPTLVKGHERHHQHWQEGLQQRVVRTSAALHRPLSPQQSETYLSSLPVALKIYT